MRWASKRGIRAHLLHYQTTNRLRIGWWRGLEAAGILKASGFSGWRSKAPSVWPPQSKRLDNWNFPRAKDNHADLRQDPHRCVSCVRGALWVYVEGVNAGGGGARTGERGVRERAERRRQQQECRHLTTDCSRPTAAPESDRKQQHTRRPLKREQQQQIEQCSTRTTLPPTQPTSHSLAHTRSSWVQKR